MNPTSTRAKVKALKIKMQNLELEIQSLIQGAEFEPGTIDAVYQDITNFTDEIRDISKQLLALKTKKNESMSLLNVYENMKEGFQGDNDGDIDGNGAGFRGGELELSKYPPIKTGWDEIYSNFENEFGSIYQTNPSALKLWFKKNYNPPTKK